MARDRITPGRWATMRRPRATEERTKVGGIKITLAVAWGMDPWEPKNKMETSVRKLVYGHKKRDEGESRWKKNDTNYDSADHCNYHQSTSSPHSLSTYCGPGTPTSTSIINQ